MNFSDKDAAAFWPIYRKYEYQRSLLDDRRAAVIKEYAQKYSALSDVDAKAMAERMFDCESRLGGVEENVFQEVQHGTPSVDGHEVLSVRPSHRLAGGDESGGFPSLRFFDHSSAEQDSSARALPQQ